MANRRIDSLPPFPQRSAQKDRAEDHASWALPLGADTVHDDVAAQNSIGEIVGLPPPQVVAPPSRYTDEGPVGRGGMSDVRRVQDREVGRRVALKHLRRSGTAPDAEANRFLMEASITGQLEHPNIIPVHEVGVMPADGSPYFTMKLVEGQTFADQIRATQDEPLTPASLEVLLDVFVRICDAVAYAHSRGVVHRDLKPENIMVASHGQVYVMDWGVAFIGAPSPADAEGIRRVVVSKERLVGEESGYIVGTLLYMSPEQARGHTEEIDSQTDIFGLGAILYTLLAGRPPYDGRSAVVVLSRARDADIESVEQVAPHRSAPPELARIALKAMSKAKGDRHATVAALKADVATVMRGGGWFQTLRFPAGTVIVQEGTPGEAAFILLKGECDVFKMERDKRRDISRLGPGEVFGEVAVFTSRLRVASVVARTDVEVKVVTRDSLGRELVGREWLHGFVTALANRFAHLDGEVTRLRGLLAELGHPVDVTPSREG